MEISPLPYEQMIFVCTNARGPGERISCAGQDRCGQKILDRLKSYVKEHRLEDKVRVAKSGCQEKCEEGPNAMVLPSNEFLSHLQEQDVDVVIEKFLSPLR